MKTQTITAVLIIGLFAAIVPAMAGTVGQNTPFVPVTPERLAGRADSAAWQAYLARSKAQMQADKAALAAEPKPGETAPPAPAESHGSLASMPLNRDAAWYASAEARHVADVIVSYQTPAGGWGKNQPRNGALRLPGQAYVSNNTSKFLTPDDYDAPSPSGWDYVGTLDNDATTTELRYLGRVAAAVPSRDGDTYRASFLKGLRYLIEAQYPNGGWPQVWPLEGGYHDAITFNDNAVAKAAEVLNDAGAGDYAFVPKDLRSEANAAAGRAVDCILATQVKINGRLTIWGQQHDPLSLAPTSARNFEMPALAAAESGDLLIYLMQRPNPSPAVKMAIRAGIGWLQAHALHDLARQKVDGDRKLIASAGAPLLWARFYSLDDEKPVFGDRDKSVHDEVSDLSFERRNGYAWYNTAPQAALDAYAAWSLAHKD